MKLVHRAAGGDPRTLAAELRRRGTAGAEGIAKAVAETIDAVREGGDDALLALGERFDGVAATQLWVPRETIEAALEELDPGLRGALETAIANVEAVAKAQRGSDEAIAVELPQGQDVEIAEVAVSAAAIYVPAGRAPYPSSVIMGVVPARVAGVGRVVVASPPAAGGGPAAPILAAAALCGADAVLAAGGAQAIAALAYGTETIEPVDVIAGPGSPWVQEAKLQCSRVVGIDGYAGPSELVVLTDGEADERWLALDLLAQGEQVERQPALVRLAVGEDGEDGLLVAVGPDGAFLSRLGERVQQLAAARASVCEATVHLVETADLTEALELAEAVAPEHLQIAAAGAERIAADVTTAGCVFVGPESATAFGDYAAGSNHVLPTGGAGRFSGPLAPGTFRRRISRVRLDAASAARLAPTVETIARAEGFPVHGESSVVRSEGRSPSAERE